MISIPNSESKLLLIANSWIIGGLTALGLHAIRGLHFVLSTGTVSFADFLLATGLLIHLGIAIASWWESPAILSSEYPV
jgi:hypothetical protein